MDPSSVIDIFRGAMYLIILFVGIILLPGLLVGLLVAMFQAATQINEMTLNFIPRLFVTIAVLVMAGPWILNRLLDYTITLIRDIPYLIG